MPEACMSADSVEGKRKYPLAIEAASSRAVIHQVDALIIEQPLTLCSKGHRKWMASLRTHELRQIIRMSKLGRAAVGNAVWPRVELRDA
jgi:hypothetical protein